MNTPAMSFPSRVIGKLVLVDRKARIARNPKTGEPVQFGKKGAEVPHSQSCQGRNSSGGSAPAKCNRPTTGDAGKQIFRVARSGRSLIRARLKPP